MGQQQQPPACRGHTRENPPAQTSSQLQWCTNGRKHLHINYSYSVSVPHYAHNGYLIITSPVFQIEAGQYCTFVISSDGSVRACGKGSYGRLGLGDSNNQSTLKKLTFEPHRAIKKVSSSKGSDGHTLAFTSEGEVFSWGDGDYGKLGHGNSSTQKYPKLIQGPLQGKVLNSCSYASFELFGLSEQTCEFKWLMFSASCVCVCRWWFVFQQDIDTVLQSVRMENFTLGEKATLAD